MTPPTGSSAPAVHPAGAAGDPQAEGPHAEGPFAADLDAYRLALRDHLRTEPALERFRGRRYPSTEARMADHARLERLLYDAGWSRYGWPAAAGGLGGDERHRAALYDELAAAGLPVPGQHMLLETLGPPVVRFAPALAAAHLPAFLRGEEWWAQGFSEPQQRDPSQAFDRRIRLQPFHQGPLEISPPRSGSPCPRRPATAPPAPRASRPSGKSQPNRDPPWKEDDGEPLRSAAGAGDGAGPLQEAAQPAALAAQAAPGDRVPAAAVDRQGICCPASRMGHRALTGELR